MKKLIFAFALMVGVMFTSCGNPTNSVNTDKDSVQVDSLDSILVDTTMCLD